MAALKFAYLLAKDTCSQFKTVLLINSDPQNMALETIISSVISKMAKIWRITDFCVMAS